MKLFLILYAAGKIGGAVGPLPYDEAEFSLRAEEMRKEFKAYKETSDWRVECEWRLERPTIGDSVAVETPSQ